MIRFLNYILKLNSLAESHTGRTFRAVLRDNFLAIKDTGNWGTTICVEFPDFANRNIMEKELLEKKIDFQLKELQFFVWQKILPW